MTIDKTINPWLGLAVEQSTTRPAKPNDTVKSDAGLKPSARPTSAAEFISVSPAAKGIIQAVRDTSDDAAGFDPAKVEAIRREIAEGRFPLDADKLARKFRELEEQLGDLG